MNKPAPSTTIDVSARNGSESSPPASSSIYQHLDASATSPSLNLENINLIINWFTETVYTVNSTSNHAVLKTCQTVILKQAMQHPFLLHALLALSALHIADTHSDPQTYTEMATAHHTQGLTLFHSVLTNINENNYSASIAFSSLTFFFYFGTSRAKLGKVVGIEIVDELAQISMLAKGWHEVVDVADGLECRAGSSILKPPTPSTSALSADTELAFSRLCQLIQGHNQDAAVYILAVSLLKSVFRELEDGKTDDPNVAGVWIARLPDGFVRLLKEKQDLALVVVGFFCVVLDKVPQVWWLRGWSKGLFGAVWRGVDPIYREVLEWPRQMIGIE